MFEHGTEYAKDPKGQPCFAGHSSLLVLLTTSEIWQRELQFNSNFQNFQELNWNQRWTQL